MIKRIFLLLSQLLLVTLTACGEPDVETPAEQPIAQAAPEKKGPLMDASTQWTIMSSIQDMADAGMAPYGALGQAYFSIKSHTDSNAELVEIMDGMSADELLAEADRMEKAAIKTMANHVNGMVDQHNEEVRRHNEKVRAARRETGLMPESGTEAQ